jgi:hypothetical protein
LRTAASPGSWATEDELKVQVTGTVVEYSKNGIVFYTSTEVPTFPLHVDAAIHDVGGTLLGRAARSSPVHNEALLGPWVDIA